MSLRSAQQLVFYIQDSDDVYGLFRFDPAKEQSIQSQPEGRFLSLHFLRDGGTLGNVSLTLTALYIPAGPIDPALSRDRVLNVSNTVNVLFSLKRMVHVILPIRNDAFLQNGAHFLIQVTMLDEILAYISLCSLLTTSFLIANQAKMCSFFT